MVFKTNFKVKTTLIAIFALISIAAVCMASLSCANNTEYVYEESISLMTMPDKTEYFVGDTLDLTGLAVTSIGKNGKPAPIPDSEITVEPPHGTTLGEAGTLTVTVSHGKRSLNFPIKVAQASSCLYVKTPPKRAYYAGERLDLSGLELVLRKNGEETTIAYSDAVSSEPENGAVLSILADEEDGSQATRTIALSYGDLNCSFNVSIRAVRLVDLYLKSLPDRTNYYTGGTLELAGLELAAAFSDGTVSIVDDYTVTETTDFAKVGRQSVTLSYLDKEISFPIEIQKTYIAFSRQPQDAEIALYAEGETLSAETVLVGDGELRFAWYRKNPGEADFSEIVRSEPERIAFPQTKESVLVLPKNDYLTAAYYCEATLTRSGGIAQSARSNTAHVTQCVETGLPVVRIDTENGAGIFDKVTEVPMNMKISNENYSKSNYKGTIRIRGNATAGYPKRPYKIKLSEKAEILGMPKNKSWVLLANYCDKTLMRTAIGFKTSELLNLSWTPKAEFVEVIINDEYLGNYELTESVKEGKNRVDINDDVKKGDYGYLIEKDGYYAREPVWFVTSDYKYGYSFKFPDNEDITTEIKEYIENYINDFERVLKSENSLAFDEENGYQKYIDLDSWCRWFLVQNIIANLDSNYFMYKKDTTSSKLYMGPVWDFEWSIGIGWYNGARPNPNHRWIKPIYFERLMEDSHFSAKVKEIWKSELAGLETELLEYIEELREKLSKSQNVNFTRWNIMNSVVSVGGIPMGSYDAEVDCDKAFLSEHIRWLDTAINGL